jgi:hypothetical protein
VTGRRKRLDVAPSDELRKWYAHKAEKFEEFARRYRDELDTPDRATALRHLEGRYLDVDLGDVRAHPVPPQLADDVTLILVWNHESPGFVGRTSRHLRGTTSTWRSGPRTSTVADRRRRGSRSSTWWAAVVRPVAQAPRQGPGATGGPYTAHGRRHSAQAC